MLSKKVESILYEKRSNQMHIYKKGRLNYIIHPVIFSALQEVPCLALSLTNYKILYLYTKDNI